MATQRRKPFETMMDRCREVKLRLSLKKLQFRVKEVRFHGHVLSAEGLKAGPDKVRAVLDMPNPTRCAAFCGVCELPIQVHAALIRGL